MRILVLDVAARDGGALQILKEFYESALSSGMEYEWTFIVSTDQLLSKGNVTVKVLRYTKKNWLCRLFFEIYHVRILDKVYQPDIILSLENILIGKFRAKKVVYMHQIIPFQTEFRFRFWKRDEFILFIYQHIIGRLIKLSFKKADYVVVQAEWIRDKVLSYICLKRTKVLIHKIRRNEIVENMVIPNFNHFIFPTSGAIYKNHNILLKAAQLIIKNGDSDFRIEITCHGESLLDQVQFIGYRDHKHIIEKLEGSVLLFPSLIETVGLPLIEAMSVGTFIIVADLPYAREAIGNYPNALFFNPRNEHELANIMIYVMKNGSNIFKRAYEDPEPSERSVLSIIGDISNEIVN